mgnify:CR=1 FL=1
MNILLVTLQMLLMDGKEINHILRTLDLDVIAKFKMAILKIMELYVIQIKPRLVVLMNGVLDLQLKILQYRLSGLRNFVQNCLRTFLLK